MLADFHPDVIKILLSWVIQNKNSQDSPSPSSVSPKPQPDSSRMTPFLSNPQSSVLIYFYNINLWYLDSVNEYSFWRRRNHSAWDSGGEGTSHALFICTHTENVRIVVKHFFVYVRDKTVFSHPPICQCPLECLSSVRETTRASIFCFNSLPDTGARLAFVLKEVPTFITFTVCWSYITRHNKLDWVLKIYDTTP